MSKITVNNVNKQFKMSMKIITTNIISARDVEI